ncbi:hypothetical protein WA026_003118 [Henosepilachna vigintioctopunctata]|uniref:Uncharacterized protein n=1 Tax=Henosepilachna vigintioctopunctata TaxID=420089 RepID=A0AAW1TMH0_9CUCU
MTRISVLNEKGPKTNCHKCVDADSFETVASPTSGIYHHRYSTVGAPKSANPFGAAVSTTEKSDDLSKQELRVAADRTSEPIVGGERDAHVLTHGGCGSTEFSIITIDSLQPGRAALLQIYFKQRQIRIEGLVEPMAFEGPFLELSYLRR